ncbi:hypothetical protein ACOXXX_12985 [Thalassococcus sp. BH17M4-6]|uniref:hypothetical protein n=1 Tax=Thalassococcus sp. BH17M4-6 TaxID=3413148 RepID=UPI003BCDE370
MRKYAFRKQTRGDFESRLKRLDPAFADGTGLRSKTDATQRRPGLSMLAGFGWFYVVILIANRKDQIRDSLSQGTLPADYHDMIIIGLGAVLAVSGVMLLLHLFRVLTGSGNKRSNSKGLLTGATAAFALIYTPPSVVDTAIGMLDSNSRSILMAAHSTVTSSVPGVDWNNVTLVSSLGK